MSLQHLLLSRHPSQPTPESHICKSTFAAPLSAPFEVHSKCSVRIEDDKVFFLITLRWMIHRPYGRQCRICTAPLAASRIPTASQLLYTANQLLYARELPVSCFTPESSPRHLHEGSTDGILKDHAAQCGPVQTNTVSPERDKRKGTRKVDIRLPGKGNSNSRGARPVYSFR